MPREHASRRGRVGFTRPCRRANGGPCSGPPIGAMPAKRERERESDTRAGTRTREYVARAQVSAREFKGVNGASAVQG